MHYNGMQLHGNKQCNQFGSELIGDVQFDFVKNGCPKWQNHVITHIWSKEFNVSWTTDDLVQQLLQTHLLQDNILYQMHIASFQHRNDKRVTGTTQNKSMIRRMNNTPPLAQIIYLIEEKPQIFQYYFQLKFHTCIQTSGNKWSVASSRVSTVCGAIKTGSI